MALGVQRLLLVGLSCTGREGGKEEEEACAYACRPCIGMGEQLGGTGMPGWAWGGEGEAG